MVRAHPGKADCGSNLKRLIPDSAETNTVNVRNGPRAGKGAPGVQIWLERPAGAGRSRPKQDKDGLLKVEKVSDNLGLELKKKCLNI